MSTASPRVSLRRTVENHWDLSAFNWKLGLLTLVLLTVIAVLVGKLQNEGLALGLGLLMSLLVLATSPKESRGWALTRFAVLGTVATYLGVAINSDGIIMAIALGLVCFLASFGAAMNPAFAGVASMLSIWLLMALTLLGDGESPFTRAIYFLIGALIVAIPVVIMDRKKGIQREPLFTAPKEAIARLSTASPDLAYAFLFAAVAVISLVAGLIFTPEHPQWTASTAVILMPAVGGGSFVKTVQRVVGTAIGAFLVVAVITRIGSDNKALLIGIAVISGFMMSATIKVNSVLFALFLTAMIVAATSLSDASIHDVGRERVIATALGAAFAILGMLLSRLIPGADADDTAPVPA